MIVLDENIVASQREQLRAWRLSFRQIGQEIGRKGLDDTEEILPLLHQLTSPTFFTRDADFYQRALRHPGYCLVILAVPRDHAARAIRRFRRHPRFDTRAKRMGCVVRVSTDGLAFWQWQIGEEQAAEWPQSRHRF
jgi:hypothetical protein